MIYIPGDLFAVNDHTVRSVNNVLARNERVVAVFENDHIGEFALVLVGAIFVGSIETVWAGEVTPPKGRKIITTDYNGTQIFKKGEEMGRFNMGSTVVMLFPQGSLNWSESITLPHPVQMGEALARMQGVSA
jgi:phosphatidylserine decarboxylase